MCLYQHIFVCTELNWYRKNGIVLICIYLYVLICIDLYWNYDMFHVYWSVFACIWYVTTPVTWYVLVCNGMYLVYVVQHTGFRH